MIQSDAKSSFAALVTAQSTQEIDTAEIGPEGIAEVIFAVRALPKKKTAEADLTGGTDDEIWVGNAGGVEVTVDVARLECVREIFERPAIADRCLDKAAYGIGDLFAATVTHSDVEQHAVVVSCGFLELLKRFEHRTGKVLEAPNSLDAYAMFVDARVRGKVACFALEELHKVCDLELGTFVEVVGAEDPNCHMRDTQAEAPLEHLMCLFHTEIVAEKEVVQAQLAGEAPVAVQDKADVSRCGVCTNFLLETLLIEVIERFGHRSGETNERIAQHVSERMPFEGRALGPDHCRRAYCAMDEGFLNSHMIPSACFL